MQARDDMHSAQCLAGIAFSSGLLGIVHSMAHKTGAVFADYGAHIIHGADSYYAEQGFVPENVFLERLHDIAANAILDACTGSNPRQPSQEEMEKLLKCCYYDLDVDF